MEREGDGEAEATVCRWGEMRGRGRSVRRWSDQVISALLQGIGECCPPRLKRVVMVVARAIEGEGSSVGQHEGGGEGED